RHRYNFVVVGYVVMPEHVHLLVGEPEKGTPSTVMQVLKQRFADSVLRARRRRSPSQALLWEQEAQHIWQARFYDFNVWSRRKPGHPAPPPAQNFQLNNCCADAHSMPWAAAEAKPSNSIVCSLVSPDSAVLGKPRGGSSRRNTKAAVGYITAKMLHTEPKRPMS